MALVREAIKTGTADATLGVIQSLSTNPLNPNADPEIVRLPGGLEQMPYADLMYQLAVYTVAKPGDRWPRSLAEALRQPRPPGGAARFAAVPRHTGHWSLAQRCIDSQMGIDCDADGVWRPPVCRNSTGNGACVAQVLTASGPSVLEREITRAGIPVEVVYTTAEAVAAAAWHGWSTGAPVLFQWITPGNFIHGLPPQLKFVRVGINQPRAPDVTAPQTGSNRSGAAARPMAPPAPDLQEVLIPVKLAATDRLARTAIDALAFLRVFELTDADMAELNKLQLKERIAAGHPEMFANYYDGSVFQEVLDGGDPSDLRVSASCAAACTWIKRHPSKWADWIKFPSKPDYPWDFSAACFTAEECYDRAAVTAAGWWYVVIQFWLGIGLLFAGYVLQAARWATSTAARKLHPAEAAGAAPRRHNNSGCGSRLASAVFRLVETSFADQLDKHNRWINGNPIRTATAASVLCSHVRTIENFSLPNSDPQLVRPPGTGLEVEMTYTSRMLHFWLVASSPRLVHVARPAAGYALVGGAVASFFWCLERHHAYLDARWGHADPQNELRRELIEPVTRVMSTILSDFKFYPTFAVLGLLTFMAKRWRGFIIAAWRIEGRVKDISIIVGSSVVDPADAATVGFLFKVYRYIVGAMMLQYRNLVPEIAPDPFGKLRALGVLTAEEVALIEPLGASRAQEVVLSWIGVETMKGARTGLLCKRTPVDAVMEKLCAMRAACRYFHGNNFYPVSNIYYSLVVVSVDVFAGLIVLGAPFRGYVGGASSESESRLEWLSALQLGVSIGTFLVLVVFWGTLAVCEYLQKPFEQDNDTFNIDALAGGTEETVFACLRAGINNTETPLPGEQVRVLPKVRGWPSRDHSLRLSHEATHSTQPRDHS